VGYDLTRDRALAAFYGLAIGDALGMPTQDLPRARAGTLIDLDGDDFVDGPHDNPISAGMPAGSVTDDTEQALVIAALLIEGNGYVDPRRQAELMLAWEKSMAVRGSLDLLGPSTKRALEAVARGDDPTTTGTSGTTNGAAMRVAPVGIAVPPEPLEQLVDAVVSVDLVTHDTHIAHAGAVAVAAVVSAGVAGEDFVGALPTAMAAARLGARRGHWSAGPDVGRRIVWAVDLARATRDARGETAALAVIDQLVGTSLATQESVPAAFAVASLCPDHPWRAMRLAAAVGGDTDTIAAMVGAMLGATHGLDAFPPLVRQTVCAVNDLDLEILVDGLLRLRAAAPASDS
jgi:ADP-ribosylglycohydrolase